MRQLQGLLIVILAALIFPGSFIALPASDAFMAAVSATLFMIGMNPILGGDSYRLDAEEVAPPREALETTQR